MKISIPWDVYTECVYGMCIRDEYTGCVYGMCIRDEYTEWVYGMYNFM